MTALATFKGLLGWSNKRIGLEFYRYDEKIIPRHNSEWGDLLVLEEEFAKYEGCPVIIIVMDRKSSTKEIDEMRNGIASQILEYN